MAGSVQEGDLALRRRLASADMGVRLEMADVRTVKSARVVLAQVERVTGLLKRKALRARVTMLF